MPNQLHAARYADTGIGGSSPNELFSEISDLGIRWTAVGGGVQRVELTVRNKNKLDGYRRYDEHLGHTFAIYDDYLHSYISAQCFEVVPDGRHTTYIMSGPFKRTYDDTYDNIDWKADLSAVTDTDVAIKSVLTRAVTVDDTDQTNIDGSGVNVGGWTPKHVGTRAGDAILELAPVGDSSDNPMDFYFVDQEFYRTQMQAPLPYFKSRSTTASPNWIFSIEDLAPNGLTLARHIWDLKTHIQIGYGRLAGTCTAGSGAALIDGVTASFITDQVRPGDRAINLNDNTVFEVATVDSATQLSFTDTTVTNWANLEKYSIKMRDPKWTTSSAGSSDYWTVEHREVRMEMDQTQAEQYRDQLYALYNDAQLQQAFVISAPTIKDGYGVNHALWEPFFGTSFYFRADNLFVDEAVFNDSDDRANSFMAVAMDYRHSTSRLRVVPSTGDSRLDAILGQAGLLQGQIISTETAWRNRKREEEAVI